MNLESITRSDSLGERLSPLLSGHFFRPLTRPSAKVYIDCANRLAEAADAGGQVLYPDARDLIREVLSSYPDAHLEEDEGGHLQDINQKAGQFFNKLLEAGWIEDHRISLDERWVLLSPRLHLLLRFLQDLAEDRPAELKDFAASLRSICTDLLRPDALNPETLDPEVMRQTIKDLNDRANRAISQMHAVETLVTQQEAAQRSSDSAQETLNRFLVDFHTGEHMICYDALQEAGLLPRLHQARALVQDAVYDTFIKQRLAEGLMKHLNLSDSQAYAEAENWLRKLEAQLEAIPIKQRMIDNRMAEFSRLSAARYRYQTEMRGRRPQQVKSYLDASAVLDSGKTFADLAKEPGMELLSTTISVFSGIDSLARPRKARPPVNLDFHHRQANPDTTLAQEEMRRRNLYVLTPQRAARFIDTHLSTKGARISSDQFKTRTEDDLLDLLAALSFDRGPAPNSHRQIHWKVESARSDFGTAPDKIPHDLQGEHFIERLTLIRLS